MALDYLPSPSWAVIYGETPSATRWSELGENDDALATGAGIDDLAILTRHLNAGAVTNEKMNFDRAVGSYGPNSAVSITSTSYVNITGRSVTVTVGPSGKILLGLGGYIDTPSSAAIGIFLIANLSGANAHDTDLGAPSNSKYMRAGSSPGQAFFPLNAQKLITGLTPGSTTFQLMGRLAGSSGSASITRPFITVTPL